MGSKGTTTERSPRILVVEDDDDQRMLICDSLRIYYGEANASNIVPAPNGEKALAHDLANFDVVLLDFDLPDMPGLAVMAGILERIDLPVMIVSGHNETAAAAESIQLGAQDYIVKLGDYLFAIPVLVDKAIRQHRIKKENQVLQQELQAMLAELKEKNLQLQAALDKQEALATTDHLTGLANRRRFNEVLERSYNEAVRYGFDLTCCMCDLDHYKLLNDTLGHQIGDEILVLTADVIRSTMRGSDVAARYGGDEFILLLPHTSIGEAQSVCERIRQQFDLSDRHQDKLEHPVTLSMGVASLSADKPGSPDELVRMADRAMYRAKQQGKDRVVLHSQPAVPAHQ